MSDTKLTVLAVILMVILIILIGVLLFPKKKDVYEAQMSRGIKAIILQGVPVNFFKPDIVIKGSSDKTISLTNNCNDPESLFALSGTQNVTLDEGESVAFIFYKDLFHEMHRIKKVARGKK